MPRELFLATSGGNCATVWSFDGDGPEGTQPGELEGHIAPITSLSFTRQGRRLASGGRDGVVVVWDVRKDGVGVPVELLLLRTLFQACLEIGRAFFSCSGCKRGCNHLGIGLMTKLKWGVLPNFVVVWRS